MGWGMAAASLISTAGSVGMASNAGDSGPSGRDLAMAQKQGIWADIDTLPTRRMIEAAARAGTKVTVEMPGKQKPIYDFREVPVTDSRGNAVLDADGKPIMKAMRVKIGMTPKFKELDFTGQGDADVAAINAEKMANTLLDLSRKYGSQFIQQRLKELQESDPEGFQARKDLYAKIMDQTENAPDTEMATTLRDQLMDEIRRGGDLDADSEKEVEQNVRRRQAAIGNVVGDSSAFQEAMSVGQAAEQRRAQRQQKGLAFLTSGATPDDIEFRKFQQDIGNLGSFLGGETPLAQFDQLSGAQQGAAPFMAGQEPLPGLNPNAAQSGTQLFEAQQQWKSQQVNPWVAGISTAANGLGAFGQMGAFSGWGKKPVQGGWAAGSGNIGRTA